MSNNQTVTIGGRQYDAHTGLSVEPVEAAQTHPHATAVHTAMQRSQTLNRTHAKKPAVVVPKPVAAPHHRTDIRQSPSISRFAPHPQVVRARKPVMDIRPAQPHPIVAKVEATRQAKAVTSPSVVTPKPSDIIKKEAIETTLAQAPAHSANAHQLKRKHTKRSRTLSIVSASFALILLAGYLTYLNMPSLSVRVAAAQAGIDATYPQYHPDGYSLKGAITYKEGEVAMNFTSNGGPQSFSLTQQKSSWDSSAVQQFVANKTKGQYLTDIQKGVTIYTYGGDAAWVSGGILYTINGDAPLSSDQIDRIATSM